MNSLHKLSIFVNKHSIHVFFVVDIVTVFIVANDSICLRLTAWSLKVHVVSALYFVKCDAILFSVWHLVSPIVLSVRGQTEHKLSYAFVVESERKPLSRVEGSDVWPLIRSVSLEVRVHPRLVGDLVLQLDQPATLHHKRFAVLPI